MNVLMISRILPFHAKGGMQDITWLMAEGLIKSGINLTLLTSEMGETKGVPSFVKTLPGTSPFDRAGFWKKLLKYDLSQVDLIHSQSSSGFPLVFKKPKNIPFICSMHGTTYDELKSTYNVRGLEALPRLVKLFSLGFAATDIPLFHLSDIVIATSNEQAKIFNKIYKVPKQKVRTIYNSMDFERFSPLSKEQRKTTRLQLGFKEDEKIFLCVNRLVEDKNTKDIIGALKELEGNFRLIIIGGGPLENELKSLTKELNLEDKVVFKGFLDFSELPKYFACSDLFINYTKRQNGYDLTMLQALACETPIIASAIGSHPTVIKDESFGLLIDWKKPKKLHDAFQKFLDGKLSFQPEKARKETVETFNLHKMTKDYIALYEELGSR